MPSAKKNEKSKGTSAVAASRRSSGQATQAASRTSPARSAATKTLATKTAATKTSPSKVSVTKSASGVADEAAAKARATAAAAPKKSAAKTAKTAAKTSAAATVPAGSASARASSKPKAGIRAAADKTVETAAPVKAVAKPAKSPASPARSDKDAPAASPVTPAAVATAAKTASPVKPTATTTVARPQPAVQQSAPKPVKLVDAPAARVAPTAPASAAATAARNGAPRFPAAPAAAGKTSSTPTAGEDKKLAKRNEPSVMTAPVAAEKTVTETKAVAKPAPAPAKAKPAGPKHGFKLNEFIVYPAHGVGQIVGMETQEVAGFSLELFVVSFIKDKMILKVPTSKVANVGMRKLAETNVVEKALATLSGRARVKRTMWSRRAQEYEAKINSGDLVTIAEVVRDLYRSDTQPEQSYSERQLYEAALDRMAREVAAVRKLIDSEALKLIESFLQKGPRRGQKTDAEVADEADEEDVDRAA